MSTIKETVGRKAAKSTFRHSVRGAFSKASRTPMRSTTLLAAGGLLGGLAGWVVARRAVSAPQSA